MVILMTTDRILGITVLADFILSEGVDRIIENLLRVGATSVACNPTVTAPAPQGEGSFQPPLDAGSSPREFDRELFGKRSAWLNSAPSYRPNPEFYSDSVYGPRVTKELSYRLGSLIGDFIEAAKAAGLRVYLQLGAVQPTGLRDEDRPRQVDGSVAPVPLADTGSLASSAIRAYNRAYVKDLLATYPEISGFRIDWPEYPCYTMSELFHDFSPHVEQWACANGFDFQWIRKGVGELHQYLSGKLTRVQLMATRDLKIDRAFANLTGEFNGAVAEWLKLKAALSADLVADWRAALVAAGRPELELTAHAFMPPYSTMTGLDFTNVQAHCDFVSPKFYTMHWPLMVKFWSDWLIERNGHLDFKDVMRTVASWMELGSTSEIEERLGRYKYPKSDEEHPIPIRVQQRKLEEVRQYFSAKPASLVPLVHGYGPLEDFASRFQMVAESEVQGLWINRYGYLSDEKLAVIEQSWS